MRLFKSWWRIKHGFGTSEAWWENMGKWKSPDKLNEGIWHRLREVEENAPIMETGIRKQLPSKTPTEKELKKLK